MGPQVSDEYLYGSWTRSTRSRARAGKTMPQIALNWLRGMADGGEA